jgi:hypothetical protein
MHTMKVEFCDPFGTPMLSMDVPIDHTTFLGLKEGKTVEAVHCTTNGALSYICRVTVS